MVLTDCCCLGEFGMVLSPCLERMRARIKEPSNLMIWRYKSALVELLDESLSNPIIKLPKMASSARVLV